jgi:hypothetical protein
MSGMVDLGHPPWCDGRHGPGHPVHLGDVGGPDIEVSSELDLSVALYMHEGRPVEVWLAERRRTDTAVTQLTVEQANELGRRLMAAAAQGRGTR